MHAWHVQGPKFGPQHQKTKTYLKTISKLYKQAGHNSI
jgi:hypothetical protein